MVKKQHLLTMLFIVSCTSMILIVNSVLGQTRAYHLEREGVKVWMNQDGTIDLFYNITLVLDSGDDIHFITVGQPNGDFTLGQASDQYGNNLAISDASSGNDYIVRVNLASALTAGHKIWFTLTTNVAHMIYNDSKMNPGNVGMQFTPTWWDQATVSDLRILVVLPPNVTIGEVKTLTNVEWNSTSFEGSQLTLFFEKQDLSPGQRYPIGVSFPKQYVQSYDPFPPEGGQPFNIDPSTIIAIVIGLVLFVGLLVSVLTVVAKAARKQYLSPQLSMETLGIRRGLTAVEASYLLDMKPTRLVTEILYSLLKKRAVWVENTKPSIKIKIMPQFEDKQGTIETPLRYYEIDFLQALKTDGTLDEEKLARTIMSLRDNVEAKIRGYRRADTIAYYKNVVAKAWEQVEQAGTTELASNAYDEQLLWLLLDPNVKTHTDTIFHDRIFQPIPLWFWYWYGYQQYSPHPTYIPNIQNPALSTPPPSIPGSDFANNIATSLEGTANNIVVNIEKFANAIIPSAPAKASHDPVHHDAACVCACHACACACACVSCACACAGGGVG
jgi:hypothetical protein